MALILLLAVLGALWMRGKGRIGERQAWGIGLGLLGGLFGIRGRPLIGAGLIAAGAAVGLTKPRAKRATKAPTDDSAMLEACALLGVDRSASDEDIRAAHRRLIALNHPDRGGTAASASRINAARDLLLQRNAGIGRS